MAKWALQLYVTSQQSTYVDADYVSIVNRVDEELDDVKDKVYSRDIFARELLTLRM